MSSNGECFYVSEGFHEFEVDIEYVSVVQVEIGYVVVICFIGVVNVSAMSVFYTPQTAVGSKFTIEQLYSGFSLDEFLNLFIISDWITIEPKDF